MYNFTVIIPTHNRHNYMSRSMEYFRRLDAKVIYCDSSENEYEGDIYSNINYIHLPSMNFAEKILFALKIIETDYVALCPDDDFIILESLYKGSDFLENNLDFSTVTGKYFSFKEKFDGSFYNMYNQLPDDVIGGPNYRAKLFFNNYYMILWSLYRKNTIYDAFNIIKNANLSNDNFIELILGAVCTFNGNIKFIDEIWGVREISLNEHWAKRHIPIPNMKQVDIDSELNKIRSLLDASTIEGYTDLVLLNYLSQYSNTNFQIKKLLKSVIPKRFKEILSNIYSVLFNKNNNKIMSNVSNSAIEDILNVLQNFDN